VIDSGEERLSAGENLIGVSLQNEDPEQELQAQPPQHAAPVHTTTIGGDQPAEGHDRRDPYKAHQSGWHDGRLEKWAGASVKAGIDSPMVFTCAWRRKTQAENSLGTQLVLLFRATGDFDEEFSAVLTSAQGQMAS